MNSDFFLYLLQVNGIFISLYSVYITCLSKLTFHKLNRLFLLAMLPLSLIVPQINFGFVTAIPVSYTEFSDVLDDFMDVGHVMAQTERTTDTALDMANILSMLYVVGAFIFLIKFVVSALGLVQLKRKSTSYTYNGFSINIANVPSVFSCFKWIFVPLNYCVKGNEVIEHEKLHAKAHHTLDLIITEMFIVLFWFNPFIYFFRRDLKSVHEFQVDNDLLTSNVEKTHYLQLILENLESRHGIASFCNNFNGSSIKKRIKMITKDKSSIWKTTRYLLILPVLALLTLSFTPNTLDISSTANKADTPISKSEENVPAISPIRVGEYDKISAGYGERKNPITKEMQFHKAIDFAAKTGTEIIATANGIVTRVHIYEDSYGKTVMVNHGNGFETRYAQMSDYAVKEGDRVKSGDVIGYVGSSGRSTGPHLHYEVIKDGERVNPQLYIKSLK